MFTMYRGRVQMTSHILWSIGFIITFTIGGMTGVMLAIPGADFLLHNSLFLIAHFHNTIIGGVVFGYFAGVSYWWPKVFGFKLNEKLGKSAVVCWIVGFFVAFMPLYVLGFMGATRRMNHYDNPEWQPYFIVAAVGVAIIAVGVVFQAAQIIVSTKNRNKPEYRDVTGDPWDGRTLEWSISSPPPKYNFARIPQINELDAFAEAKETGKSLYQGAFRDIHMPSNTSAGIFIGVFSMVLGFSLIWHIWWLAIVCALGIAFTAIAHSFLKNEGYIIPASTVMAIEGYKGPQSPLKTGAARDVELEVV
jgi:cytochrome o ubiquinol oxidase subunit 1